MATRKAIRVSTAARMLEVNPMTVKRWIAAGRIDGFKLPSGPWRCYEDDVLKIMGDHAPPDMESAPY